MTLFNVHNLKLKLNVCMHMLKWNVKNDVFIVGNCLLYIENMNH